LPNDPEENTHVKHGHDPQLTPAQTYLDHNSIRTILNHHVTNHYPTHHHNNHPHATHEDPIHNHDNHDKNNHA